MVYGDFLRIVLDPCSTLRKWKRPWFDSSQTEASDEVVKHHDLPEIPPAPPGNAWETGNIIEKMAQAATENHQRDLAGSSREIQRDDSQR